MKSQQISVILGAGLTQFFVIGMHFSYGVFFPSFEDAFGWSRTVLSTALALGVVFMGVFAMVGGRLNDKFGPRRVLMFTGALSGIGFMLLSLINAPWQLFLIYATCIAAGLGTHDVVTLSTIAGWFPQKRGIMTAMVKVGTALGQVSLPPIAAFLILYAGWQHALVIMGGGVAVMLMIAGALMQKRPTAAIEATSSQKDGVTYKEARQQRAFWQLCVIQFLFFPVVTALPLHIAAHGVDLGMSQPTAASLLSVIGGASILGRIVVGLVIDRLGGPQAMMLCLLILSVGTFGLVLTDNHFFVMAILAFYGFAHGGLFTVVSPTIAAFFGMSAHGAIFGAILFAGTIGGAIGPILVGAVFDLSGSYDLAFQAMGVIAFIGLVLAWLLPPSKQTMVVVHDR